MPPPQHEAVSGTMDQTNISQIVYPVLIIPKHSTKLESICEVSDNVFIKLKITTPDTDGNEMCIYSGFCNVKLIDNCNINFHLIEFSMENGTLAIIENKPPSETVNPIDNQSQVWIDPIRSPYVYNSYDGTGNQELIFPQSPYGQITVEQHNTYITQNVYNYNNTTISSAPEDFDQKKSRKDPTPEELPQQGAVDMNNYINFYEVDEFECGVFLSQLPEEIMNEKEIKDREEKKYIGLDSENGALKQLMSPDIQSVSKQRKTILFLGHDSHYGQTIQKIAVNDPTLMCAGSEEVDHEVEIDDCVPEKADHKKYQCDKCKQIFDQISAFKNHMISIHKTPRLPTNTKASFSKSNEVKFMCSECGKTLKNQKRFELHCMGHGDPELECNKCHKVFASKFTLRTHRKIHNRKYPCDYCAKTYTNSEAMREHVAKMHYIFMCDSCSYITENYSDLELHIQEIHNTQTSGDDFSGSFVDDIVEEADIITLAPEGHGLKLEVNDFPLSKESEIQEADSIIAKVISNEVFLLHSKKAKRRRRYKKTCDVCFKVFERVGDLKRHLIEHVIRSTLAKTPVSKSGTLNIHCEVCRAESFSQVDRYKAHLREHAKLTLYKCTFCDKSFSDSSNFSKHKKIHGNSYLQCDICQRKFNSKKMITRHMEYHKNNHPVHCLYCDKVFHFDSMLKKHMRSAHIKESSSKFRCKFCHDYFKSLKEKWDHEWIVHNVRKMIVDCLVCGSKFRKYSELKRHCHEIHEMEIPPAKKLLRKRKHK